MPSALLLAVLLAAPPVGDEPVRDEPVADDSWASRTLPTLSFVSPRADPTRYASTAQLAVLVRLDPPTVAGFPVESDLRVTFASPAAGGAPRQMFEVKFPTDGPTTGFTASPPDGAGWGTGELLLTADSPGCRRCGRTGRSGSSPGAAPPARRGRSRSTGAR